MGTKQEVSEVISHLKTIMSELGWTQNELARIIFAELNQTDNEDEIKAFQEKFKKALQRDTTKIELLQRYLEIAVSQPEAKAIVKSFKKYSPLNAISPSLSEGMKKISKEIDQYFE